MRNLPHSQIGRPLCWIAALLMRRVCLPRPLGAELLDETRHIRIGALFHDIPDPARRRRSRIRPALTTDDDPVAHRIDAPMHRAIEAGLAVQSPAPLRQVHRLQERLDADATPATLDVEQLPNPRLRSALRRDRRQRHAVVWKAADLHREFGQSTNLFCE